MLVSYVLMLLSKTAKSNWVSINHIYHTSWIGQDEKKNVMMSVLPLFCFNRPVLHSARHQRPARERHKIRNASRENVDNQAPRNTNFTH